MTTLAVTLPTPFHHGRGGYWARSKEVARLGSASTLTILEVYFLRSCRSFGPVGEEARAVKCADERFEDTYELLGEYDQHFAGARPTGKR
jgi:hypothetical protein